MWLLVWITIFKTNLSSQDEGQLNKGYEIMCNISYCVKCIETFETDNEVCIEKGIKLQSHEVYEE